MSNFDYWKQSLENVLEKENITDSLVKNIISISEMEYEYTQHESVKNENPKDDNAIKIKKLEDEIRIYKQSLCAVLGVDSVDIVGGRVEWYKRTN